MNIYLLSDPATSVWDVMVSCVVCAENETAAREIAARNRGDEGVETWLKSAECLLLGPLDPDTQLKAQLLCRDFIAG